MSAPTFTDPAGTWNRRFEGDEYVFGTEPNAWLREHPPAWQPGSRVLSVADGEGRNSVWKYAATCCKASGGRSSMPGHSVGLTLLMMPQILLIRDKFGCIGY